MANPTQMEANISNEWLTLRTSVHLKMSSRVEGRAKEVRPELGGKIVATDSKIQAFAE